MIGVGFKSALAAEADYFFIHVDPVTDLGQRFEFVGGNGVIEKGTSVGFAECAPVIQSIKFSFRCYAETGFGLGRGDAMSLAVSEEP
jgi:hypothetical protein